MCLDAEMQTRLTMNNVINLPNGRELNLIEPVIMGILNVTPDSFSDGGKFIDPISLCSVQ